MLRFHRNYHSNENRGFTIYGEIVTLHCMALFAKISMNRLGKQAK